MLRKNTEQRMQRIPQKLFFIYPIFDYETEGQGEAGFLLGQYGGKSDESFLVFANCQEAKNYLSRNYRVDGLIGGRIVSVTISKPLGSQTYLPRKSTFE